MPLSAPLHKLLCVCHIVSYFDYQKKVCQLLCLFNLRYNEDTQKFGFGHQLFIYFVCFWSLLCLPCYLMFLDGYVIDRGSLYIYLMPCLYYKYLESSMLETLNEMAKVHRKLHTILGTIFCVSVKRAYCCSWLISIELVFVIYWQIESLKNDVQRLFVFSCLFGWHLQLLLLVNSYIWLQFIYVVMNQIFTPNQLTNEEQWKRFRTVMKLHGTVQQIQRNISHYFSVYICSLVVLLTSVFYRAVSEAGFDWDQSRLVLLKLHFWHIRYFGNLILLICTLLMVLCDYKSERNKFLKATCHTQPLLQKSWSSISTNRCKQTPDLLDLMILTGSTYRDIKCMTVTLWEMRINQDTVLTLETACFMNYFFLLMLTVCLVPIIAIANGFRIDLEHKLLNFTFYEVYSNNSGPLSLTIDNLTMYSYVLSHSLE
ncbi:uncharacterized protein LOC120448903 [Drosophila santomea]|uniref:uncharacterized protein LOC120448903 n=1 Tax=Drosophila santomea TaxID=129105 RepID=UPI001953F999|nr:uncharacterized protein LOC120448903 [Drosophila santomea]